MADIIFFLFGLAIVMNMVMFIMLALYVIFLMIKTFIEDLKR
jgi:hypothetical protein